MRIYEILAEATELGSTIRTITNDIGTPIIDMFGRLKYSVSRAADNNGLDSKGNIRGLGLIIGGETGRWINTYYVGRLENELYDLVRYAPNKTAKLKQFLMIAENKFKVISSNLPEILLQVAESIKDKNLYNNAKAWIDARDEFGEFIGKVTAEAASYGETGYDTTPTIAPKDNIVGQQNANVESIINDVLSRIDRRQAGEIRNIVAKSSNKLATLQQELARRNITPT